MFSALIHRGNHLGAVRPQRRADQPRRGPSCRAAMGNGRDQTQSLPQWCQWRCI